MKIAIIIALIHLVLCILAYKMCKSEGEKEWVLFTFLCFIPILGPVFVVYLYIMSKIQNGGDDSYNE